VVPGVELVGFLSDEAVELVQSVRSHLSDEGAAAWTAKPWVQQIRISLERERITGALPIGVGSVMKTTRVILKRFYG
jgi:hypothetical protein